MPMSGNGGDNDDNMPETGGGSNDGEDSDVLANRAEVALNTLEGLDLLEGLELARASQVCNMTISECCTILKKYPNVEHKP